VRFRKKQSGCAKLKFSGVMPYAMMPFGKKLMVPGSTQLFGLWSLESGVWILVVDKIEFFRRGLSV
jgi:hypothetical protein